VIHEAMAAGVPVGGRESRGIPGNGARGANGLLVTPGDVDSFANAIVCLLEDHDCANRFAPKAERDRAGDVDIRWMRG